MVREDSGDDQVLARKGVGIAETSQRDIFRSPGTDAFDGQKLLAENAEILALVKM